jgi:fatty acid desaturase
MAQLADITGVTWLEYRKTLKPDYARAWRDIAVCYLMLFGGFAAEWAANVLLGNGPALLTALLTAPLAAIWIGFWLHALNQFGHEGAHGNLAADRKRNDFLSDWLLWPLFAQSVRSYRRSHMQHHVHLGDHLDTEINYHQCMDPWFLLKTLTGIQLLLMVVRYIVKPKSSAAGEAAAATNKLAAAPEGLSRKLVSLARTALIHGTLIAIPAWEHLFGAAAAWLLGLIAAYPCFGVSRNILEHRAFDAPCETDFTKVQHGPVNRLFGDDWFSRCFGAAGTNRHLLHHWDPGISYTRLADMEAFMLRTPNPAEVIRSRTTYFQAARAMFRTALAK